MKIDDNPGHLILSFEADDESGVGSTIRFELIMAADDFPLLRVWGHPDVDSRWYVSSATDGQALYESLVDALHYWSEDEILPAEADAISARIAEIDSVLAEEFAFMHRMRLRQRDRRLYHGELRAKQRVHPHLESVDRYVQGLNFVPDTLSSRTKSYLQDRIRKYITGRLLRRDQFPSGLHHVPVFTPWGRYLIYDFGTGSMAATGVVSVAPDQFTQQPHPAPH